MNGIPHETFSGEQAETQTEAKLRIRQQVNSLLSDLAATDINFAIEINAAITNKVIKRVKSEGSSAQREHLYSLLEQSLEHAASA